jgi:CRP/FNR family transcriptional regulator, dissimilatory nitrate respiration regulator
MTSVSCRNILEDTRLLLGLSQQWRERLAQLSRIERFTAGQTIFREGDEVRGLFCVGTGLVRVFKDGPTGKQLVLHFAHPGHTFGEVAVFGNFPAPANADAAEDTLCAVIPTDSLRGLLETHHELCLELLSATSHWVRSLVGLLEDIVLRDAAARLARYLVALDKSADSQSFTLPVLKKDLAAHLNLTQETLSRTLRKLADAGLIVSAPDGSIRISGAEELRRLAGLQWPAL